MISAFARLTSATCVFCEDKDLAEWRRSVICRKCHRAQPLIGHPVNSGGRPRVGRAGVQSFRGVKSSASGDPQPLGKHNHAKRELMEQARRAGWRGRTYHSAKKFERKLERAS